MLRRISSIVTRRRLSLVVGMLVGAAALPLLTLLINWADEAEAADGLLAVLILPLFMVWSFFAIPAELLGRGYFQFALVEALWAAVGALLAVAWHDRRERKRSP
jgi:hypothetical protein